MYIFLVKSPCKYILHEYILSVLRHRKHPVHIVMFYGISLTRNLTNDPLMASSSSFSSSSSSTSSNTVVISNISHLVPIKLDRGNYNVWRSLFLPILRSHEVLGFVDGSEKCPPHCLLDSDGKLSTSVNPKYTEWIIKDQNLLSWINATLSEAGLPYIVGLQSSRAVWEDLEKRYASLTRSHVIQLKQQLQI